MGGSNGSNNSGTISIDDNAIFDFDSIIDDKDQNSSKGGDGDDASINNSASQVDPSNNSEGGDDLNATKGDLIEKLNTSNDSIDIGDDLFAIGDEGDSKDGKANGEGSNGEESVDSIDYKDLYEKKVALGEWPSIEGLNDDIVFDKEFYNKVSKFNQSRREEEIAKKYNSGGNSESSSNNSSENKDDVVLIEQHTKFIEQVELIDFSKDKAQEERVLAHYYGNHTKISDDDYAKLMSGMSSEDKSKKAKEAKEAIIEHSRNIIKDKKSEIERSEEEAKKAEKEASILRDKQNDELKENLIAVAKNSGGEINESYAVEVFEAFKDNSIGELVNNFIKSNEDKIELYRLVTGGKKATKSQLSIKLDEITGQ